MASGVHSVVAVQHLYLALWGVPGFTHPPTRGYAVVPGLCRLLRAAINTGAEFLYESEFSFLWGDYLKRGDELLSSVT